MRAFVFPGQGSQKVGMGAELAEASAAAREVFEEVDDALGQKLFAIMREGPEDQLTLTENAQPAIMANAIAVLRVLEKEGGHRAGRQGRFRRRPQPGRIHRAVRRRRVQPGRHRAAAQAARPGDAGGGAGRRRRDGARCSAPTSTRRRRWPRPRREGEVCTVANDNDPGQVVLSGHRERDRARDRAGQGLRHQARHAAAGLGAVPLPADAARRRRDGRGAGQDPAGRAAPAALRQRHRRASSPIRPRCSACWSSRSPAASAGAKA